MNNGDDSHAMVGIIDPVDHAIGATTGAVSIIEWRTELLTDALRIVEQRPDNELMRGERNGLGQGLGEWPASRRRDNKLIAPFRHTGFPRRRIATARSCSDSPSPRASSASDAVSCRTASASDRIAIVSSSAARSSGESRTAEGRPCTVTVMRSC
jgi:hypothetical protein